MRYIASWSRWTEFTVVILGAFGFFIFSGIIGLSDQAPLAPLSAADLQFTLVYELFVLIILAIILHTRGWTLKDINLQPDPIGTVQGIGLALLVSASVIGIWIVIALLLPQVLPQAEGSAVVAASVGWGLIMAALIVNSVFEEAFVTGYVISALGARFSPWTAINASVAIRLAYHLYQGAPGVVGTISTGLIFALWYARRGTLWPLVTAHTLLNVYAFLASAE
jgi:membrane protease YdiL (CAAX protease family)